MHLYSQIGTGSMKFVSGTHYEGNWEDGCIQVTNSGGFAAQLLPLTLSISLQSEPAAPCKCTFYNGDTYEGEWAVSVTL